MIPTCFTGLKQKVGVFVPLAIMMAEVIVNSLHLGQLFENDREMLDKYQL